MKQMSLTTLTKAILMIALSLVMACAVLPACAGAEKNTAYDDADGMLASEMVNPPGASIYALAGNSVTSVIRISGGKVLGCASLTIRQGHSWSTTLSLQRQVSEQSWLNMSSITSTNSELSLFPRLFPQVAIGSKSPLRSSIAMESSWTRSPGTPRLSRRNNFRCEMVLMHGGVSCSAAASVSSCTKNVLVITDRRRKSHLLLRLFFYPFSVPLGFFAAFFTLFARILHSLRRVNYAIIYINHEQGGITDES